MGAILLGLAAFPVLALFDWAGWRGRRVLKRLALLAGAAAFGVALVLTVQQGAPLPVPPALRIIGAVLAAVFCLLLLYSLVIEIPLTVTYLSAGAPSQLVDTGSYALTRHPGILWFGPCLMGLALATRSPTLLVATPVWWLADILYVVWQDRWLFPRQFPAYRRYQQETPMLWPTRASLRRCLATRPRRRPRAGSPT